MTAPNSAVAQTIWSNPGVGNWSTAGNWTLGVPNSTSGTTFDAQIKNGGTAQLSAAGASVRRMRVGVSAGGGHLEVNGGGLTIVDDLILNFEGTGTATTTRPEWRHCHGPRDDPRGVQHRFFRFQDHWRRDPESMRQVASRWD